MYWGLSWIIMDYHGLSWIIMDYHGLSYHELGIPFLANQYVMEIHGAFSSHCSFESLVAVGSSLLWQWIATNPVGLFLMTCYNCHNLT